MQQAIESAFIGASVAAGVAIVGTVSSALTTARTLRANRETAGEGRLWAKTSEVYEKILADAAYRQLVRDHNTLPFRLDEASETRAREQLAKYDGSRPDYITLDAGVRAYASDTVLMRFDQARHAELAVSQILVEWDQTRELAKAEPHGPHAASLPTFKPQLDDARRAADAAVVALVAAVREELREGHLGKRRWYQRRTRG